jgi:hypothetical protein
MNDNFNNNENPNNNESSNNKTPWGIIVLGAGFIAGIIGFSLGYDAGKRIYSPRHVYVQEFVSNNPDVVVTNRNRDRYVFVAQPDGSYKLLEDVQKEQQSELEKKLRNLK